LSSGESTTFVLSGSSLFPCGLTLSIYRDDPSNIVATGITVTVADESTAAVVVLNSVFLESGVYYGYLCYGPSWKYQSDAVAILGGDDSSSTSQQAANFVGLIVGIIIAVLAVIAVIVVVIVFLVWRHNEIKKRTTQSDAERVGLGNVQYVFFSCIIYFLLCLLIGVVLSRELSKKKMMM
jgi:hypothetical protein